MFSGKKNKTILLDTDNLGLLYLKKFEVVCSVLTNITMYVQEILLFA